jgi:hypothetical protein
MSMLVILYVYWILRDEFISMCYMMYHHTRHDLLREHTYETCADYPDIEQCIVCGHMRSDAVTIHRTKKGDSDG